MFGGGSPDLPAPRSTDTASWVYERGGGLLIMGGDCTFSRCRNHEAPFLFGGAWDPDAPEFGSSSRFLPNSHSRLRTFIFMLKHIKPRYLCKLSCLSWVFYSSGPAKMAWVLLLLIIMLYCVAVALVTLVGQEPCKHFKRYYCGLLFQR